MVAHHYGLPFIGDGFFFEFINNGGFILSFFFVLSGYVMGYNYMNIQKFSAKKFLNRRFARLVPVYLVAFVATLITAMLLKGAFPKGISIILQGLGLHAWIPGMVLEINYPSWSVSVEVFFCFLFPCLVAWLGNLSTKQFVLVSLIVWTLSSVQHFAFQNLFGSIPERWAGELILYFPVWHVNAFLLGIAGAEVFKKLQHISLPRLAPFLIGSFLLATIVWITGTENAVRPHIHNGLLAPLIVMMLMSFSFDKSIFSTVVSKAPFVFLGNLTYAIYIFQFPVYLWCEPWLFPDGMVNMDFYSYLFILILFSALFFVFYEKPVRDRIVQRAERQTTKS